MKPPSGWKFFTDENDVENRFCLVLEGGGYRICVNTVGHEKVLVPWRRVKGSWLCLGVFRGRAGKALLNDAVKCVNDDRKKNNRIQAAEEKTETV